MFTRFRHDHLTWMMGYRDARNRTYRIPPFLNSSDRLFEMFRHIDVWAYAAGYFEGEDALMRDSGAFPQQSTVNVFAAASLTNALQDIDAAYSKSTGITIVARFGGTSDLARQLERSSAAAVFISADPQWMDYTETHCSDGPQYAD